MSSTGRLPLGLAGQEGGTHEPFERLNAICFEAQTLADDAGVDVDYECEEE